MASGDIKDPFFVFNGGKLDLSKVSCHAVCMECAEVSEVSGDGQHLFDSHCAHLCARALSSNNFNDKPSSS